MYDILKKIASPEDVKKLNDSELNTLAADIREALFNRLTKVGGHFGPNFGIVETEIAMHYVFSSPKDKFVFDVSHQSYPHKMLTGRKNGYIDEAHFKEDSGYTNPDESAHDLFNVGHTSTSLSLASGLVKGRDLVGGKENVVALIGDGSLSGGEALEALDFIGSEIHSNMIIIVNDNQQSIAENHGGLYHNLAKLRETNGAYENNFFKSLGFDYIYEKNGNDVQSMIQVLQRVKDSDHPVIVHVNTQKGKGYKPAEENREAWHWCLPFERETGLPTVSFGQEETYTSITTDYIRQKAQSDKDFVVVTPAMPLIFGLNKQVREELGAQYVDVGIAEEHAVAMASGLAKAGRKPLVLTAATFIQRTYDQLMQDVCVNKTAITVLLNYASFDSLTDVTHLGIFGLSAFGNIPNLVMLAPTSKEEYLNMLEWSVNQKDSPVMIFVPGNDITHRAAAKDYGVRSYKVDQSGEKLAILVLGDFYQKGEHIAQVVKEKLGFTPTLINPRFVDADPDTLRDLEKNHSLVITLEDGILDGGFGQKVASFYGTSRMKVKNYAFKKEFYDRYNPAELLKSQGLSDEQIVADITRLLKA